jgi:hypothetical protein
MRCANEGEAGLDIYNGGTLLNIYGTAAACGGIGRAFNMLKSRQALSESCAHSLILGYIHVYYMSKNKC